MGCLYSKKRKDAMRKNKTVNAQPRQKYLRASTEESGERTGGSGAVQCDRPEFSESQKTLVLDSWELIQGDLDKVGVQMFMKLFETHPDVQDVFVPFKSMNKEDLFYSNQLRSHAMRVMGTVDKCLRCIDDPTAMDKQLQELGTRHVMYSAKVDYIDLIGPQFIWSLQSFLGDKWNPELEQAWSDLFKLITHVMKAAMTF